MNIKFGDSSLNLKVDGSLANIDRGPRGYSAYEIAVQEGFVGTEEEWLASLVGPEGKQGKDGERGIQGPRGQQGDKGDRGDTGPQGEKGDRGDTGPQGDKGDIGPQGEKGDTGPSNVLSIGSVTKGDEANATITGESPNQILNLVLPKGDKGEKGEKGDTGPQGETGATGNGILSIQKTATAGLVDTYTTTFTNGTTTTFDVTNGEDGEVTQKQLDETNENVSWLQTLTEQMPHVAGQGTDLSLESVLNYRLMKFLPQGVSSQESTTGKNLFHILDWSATTIPKASYSSAAATRVSNNEIILTATGTWGNVSIDFGENFFNTNQNIIASADFLETISGRTSKVGIQIYGSDDGSSYTSINTTGGTDITYNVKQHLSVIANTGSYTYIRLRIWNNVTATSVTRGDSVINVSNIMLALGTDDTYEPYTGGIPAPNPSYQYPVNNVTGENSLVLQNENLVSVDDGVYNSTFCAITFKNGIGNVEIKGSAGSSGGVVVPLKTPIYLKKGKTYTRTQFTNDSYPYIALRDAENKAIDNMTISDNGIKSFTPDSDKVATSIYLWFSNKSYSDIKPMMVKGSTAPTTYAEHEEQNYQLSLGNIELNSSSDGTIRDAIIGTPDNWVKREYIGKVILDGSESYSIASSSSTRIAYETNIADIISYTNPSDVPDLISNRFTSVSYNASWKIGNISRWTNRYSLVLIVDPSISTISDFKTWLSQNNVIVWYQKSEYTDIPITDTTLISQLNDIYNNAHSYNGVTNITTTYEDGNEQMYLDIEALAKGGSTTTETDPIFSASASSGITSSDISNWNNKADVEDIPDLTEYVKDTNYAGSTKGGVIRINGNLGLSIDTSNGNLKTSVKTYAQYNSMTNSGFVGKGTLENVITGKNLADKNYVDTAIATAITNTLGGSY